MIVHGDILRIHAAAVAAGLATERVALFAGLPPALMGHISLASSPNAQILADLDHLSRRGALDDGRAPLHVWLDNAVALVEGRRQAEVLRDLRAQILVSVPVPAPAAPTPHLDPRRDPPEIEWLGSFDTDPELDLDAPDVFRALRALQAWLLTSEAEQVLGWGLEAIDAFGLGAAMRAWMRREGLWIDPASDEPASAIDDPAPLWYAGSAGRPRVLCHASWAHARSPRALRRTGARLRALAGAEQTLLLVIAPTSTNEPARGGTLCRDGETGTWTVVLVYPEPLHVELLPEASAPTPVPLPRWLPAGYLEALVSRCSRLDPVLLRQERVYRKQIGQAVELTLAYRDESTAYPALALLRDPSLSGRDAVILGDAGSGKTTLARSLALHCSKPGSPWIPVYLPLGRYRTGQLAASLEQAGLGDCRAADGRVDAARFATGSFLFLLDGYDELSDPRAFWSEIQGVLGPGTRTIVTGRFLDDLRHRLPTAAFLAVRPLSPTQIEQFIRVFEGEAAAEILAWIRQRGLEREARRPLWLIFILLVLRVRKTELTGPREGPISLGTVYRLLIEHYFLGQWETDREGAPPDLPPLEIPDYLAEVALHMGYHRELSVRRTQLEALFLPRAARWPKLPFDRLLQQIVGHQLLVFEAGEYSFPHRSFQEYFAAIGLSNHLSRSTLSDHLDEHWKDTLRMLMGILPSERAAELFEPITLTPGAGGEEERMEPGSLHGFGRAEILAEVVGFAGSPESSLGPRTLTLRRRVDQAIGTLMESSALRDAELALRLSLLLPAESALEHVALLVRRSQDVTIEAIDVLGRIFTRRALELAMDHVMRSPDERTLRRVADHVLVPHARRSGAWAGEARAMIEARARLAGGDRQDRKRRWHLVHALLMIGAADPERVRTGDADLDAVTRAYLVHESRPGAALLELVRRFGGASRVTRSSTTRALRKLLSSEDFYLRRAGAHFLRFVEFDFASLAALAMHDPAIEVRFSILKGLIELARRWPARRALATGWLTEAIVAHPEPEEEHFRQVSLGVIKHIDRRRFWPRALASLECEPVTFRVDIVHGLWDAEGLWASESIHALDEILGDPAEPERLHDEARDALGALAGRRGR